MNIPFGDHSYLVGTEDLFPITIIKCLDLLCIIYHFTNTNTVYDAIVIINFRNED